MSFLWHGVTGAFDLLFHPDRDLRSAIRVTVELAVNSTVLALAVGVPIGLALGLRRSAGRRVLLALFNAGLGLPPILVGLVGVVLLSRDGPLGSTDLLYTVRGMVAAQFFLGLPQVVAITAASAAALDPALLAQARALGAGRCGIAVFAGREARAGIAVGAIAAMGSALSEVGAVVLVGGNLPDETQTATGAVLTAINEGRYSTGIALGIVLLGLVLLLTAALTVMQGRAGRGAVRSFALGQR